MQIGNSALSVAFEIRAAGGRPQERQIRRRRQLLSSCQKMRPIGWSAIATMATGDARTVAGVVRDLAGRGRASASGWFGDYAGIRLSRGPIAIDD